MLTANSQRQQFKGKMLFETTTAKEPKHFEETTKIRNFKQDFKIAGTPFENTQKSSNSS